MQISKDLIKGHIYMLVHYQYEKYTIHIVVERTNRNVHNAWISGICDKIRYNRNYLSYLVET